MVVSRAKVRQLRGVLNSGLDFVDGTLHILLKVFPSAKIDDRQLIVIELHKTVNLAVARRRVARING